MVTPDSIEAEQPFFRSWVRATFYGWLLGFLALLAAVIVGEWIVPWESQFAVGVGMGWGVAYVQGRLLVRRVGPAKGWAWAGLVGMGLPFVILDVVSVLWGEVPGQIGLDVFFGALLTGVLQWRVLRPYSSRAGWWVPVCVVGWGLALLTVGLPYLLLGSGRLVLLNLVAILLGGVALGAVTGGALVRLLEGVPSASEPEAGESG